MAATYPTPVEDVESPPVTIPEPTPVKVLDKMKLRALGMSLHERFEQYARDRNEAEQKWLKNLRQYKGIYDPDIEAQLTINMSRAYPRVTRIKCVSVLSRLMSLMFPGNERNWELKPSPLAELEPQAVKQALDRLLQRRQEMGMPVDMKQGVPPEVVQEAAQILAEERAAQLSTLIDDYLQELGGDQSLDHIALTRKVLQSGIRFGLGVLEGPFVRPVRTRQWSLDALGEPTSSEVTRYKPHFEFLSVWDFYPDMAAKGLTQIDGYFARKVMSRQQLRKLADRDDFLGEVIKDYIKATPSGNYKARTFETELKNLGTRVNVNDMPATGGKFEVLIWRGALFAQDLVGCGADIPEDKMADDVQAEVWFIDGKIIKADMNAWSRLDVDVKMHHTFLFDETDEGPVGDGLPSVMRDSQMSICAATRMLLDNASAVAGPITEVNTDLLEAGQDISSVRPYKVYVRTGTGQEAAAPAIRNILVEGHIDKLKSIIEMFMAFADAETFVGPATGGDMDRKSSEPMRTAGGAAMVRSDAALPFKDIVRNFDTFTQSVIQSLVLFARKFDTARAPAGDFNVVARGATSLIAKEVKGMQLDILAQTLTPEDKEHIRERDFVEARLASRDLGHMLKPKGEVDAARAKRAQEQQALVEQQKQLIQAEVRKMLTDGFKNIAQGKKNLANADASVATTALNLLREGMGVNDDDDDEGKGAGSQASAGSSAQRRSA